MSAPRFTPGPWEVRDEPMTNRANVVVRAALANGRTPKLATVIEPSQHAVRERDANARLIAAAPDLYEVVRTAAECAPHTFECKPTREINARLGRGETVTLPQAYDADGECDCWKSRALAALAKAEGREP